MERVLVKGIECIMEGKMVQRVLRVLRDSGCKIVQVLIVNGDWQPAEELDIAGYCYGVVIMFW